MAAASQKADPPLEVKKYANRRYYDAANSRHLTLDDIRSLVQRGTDIRITDASSSSDITSRVLAQIILESDPEKLDLLPQSLLAALLRGENPLARESFPTAAPAKPPSRKPDSPPVSPRPQATPPAKSTAAQQPGGGEAYDLLQALASLKKQPTEQ